MWLYEYNGLIRSLGPANEGLSYLVSLKTSWLVSKVIMTKGMIENPRKNSSEKLQLLLHKVT